jgi:hypothetical protein
MQQSEIYVVGGEKVRVGMPPAEVRQSLNPTKAGVSGLVELTDASGREVLVNPALVTHVVSLGR